MFFVASKFRSYCLLEIFDKNRVLITRGKKKLRHENAYKRSRMLDIMHLPGIAINIAADFMRCNCNNTCLLHLPPDLAIDGPQVIKSKLLRRTKNRFSFTCNSNCLFLNLLKRGAPKTFYLCLHWNRYIFWGGWGGIEECGNI